jgi:predicted DNA-binding antitoxin AbrB/MazE fold protein
MKPITMISVTDEKGVIKPLKFQLQNPNKELITIRIDHISQCDEEKMAGNRMLIYRCQSQIGDTIKVYELKYEFNTCRWYLWKM